MGRLLCCSSRKKQWLFHSGFTLLISLLTVELWLTWKGWLPQKLEWQQYKREHFLLKFMQTLICQYDQLEKQSPMNSFPQFFLENYTPTSLSSQLLPKLGLKRTRWQVCHRSRLAGRCRDGAGVFRCPGGSRESPPGCEGSNRCTRSSVTRDCRMPFWGKLWEGEEQKEAFDAVDPSLKWSSGMKLWGHQDSYKQRGEKRCIEKSTTASVSQSCHTSRMFVVFTAHHLLTSKGPAGVWPLWQCAFNSLVFPL